MRRDLDHAIDGHQLGIDQTIFVAGRRMRDFRLLDAIDEAARLGTAASTAAASAALAARAASTAPR